MGKEEVNNETEVNETFTLPAIWILQLSVTTYNYIGVEMEDDDFYPARLCGLELGMVIINLIVTIFSFYVVLYFSRLIVLIINAYFIELD